MIARAPGKLVLSGAYAVLEGAPAIVAAVDRYALADTSQAATRLTDEVAAAITAGVLRVAPWFDASALRMKLADGRDVKLGLGSSAAILVASIAAAWAAEDRTLEPRTMFQAALAAHRQAQGGGSGVDVAASSFGGVLACRLGGDGGLSVQPHALPAGTVVEVFASPVSASTPELLGRVRALAKSAPTAYSKWIGAASEAAARAVEARSVGDLVAALRGQAAALAGLGEAAGAPIFTDDVRELEPLAADEEAVFLPSGAGGGDVALFVSERASSARFRARAAALGRFALGLSVGAPGVALVSTALHLGEGEGALSGEAMDRSASPAARRFRDLDLTGRRARVAEMCGIEVEALVQALDAGGIDAATADRMVENALGLLGVPFGVALNFRVNERDYVVPMAIEEPSVIAAASHAAKRALAGGGFVATSTAPIMIGQVEVHEVRDGAAAIARVLAAKDEILALADAAIPSLIERGGGARGLSARDLGEGYVVVHVEVDCREAMGANIVNTVAEATGARIAELCEGTLGLRILTNYCDLRTTRVSTTIPVEALGDNRTDGATAARGIASASKFAELDPYRAVTHNKGVANGIDAVVVATGNDWRAVEAAAHAYAARSGKYGPLSTWRLTDDGAALVGVLELPLSVGAIGGALRAHPGARLALDILGVRSSTELAQVVAAAGLATNLAALRALATEGIQRGHMRLHHRATAR